MSAENVVKAGLDWASVSVIVGSLVGWLPALASALSIIWAVIRIWETRTVQGWMGLSTPPPPSPYEPLE